METLGNNSRGALLLAQSEEAMSILGVYDKAGQRGKPVVEERGVGSQTKKRAD